MPKNLPPDLLDMRKQVEAGADPDDVLGIERLWIWQFEQNKNEWEALQRQFLEEYRRRIDSGLIT